MTLVLSCVVSALFVAWFVVTVLSHVRWTKRLVRTICSYDIVAAIPIWTFFAPNPGRTDVYLLYRDRDQHGRIFEWKEVILEKRSHWWSLWNPRRRIGKGVVDVAPDLVANESYEPRKPVSKKKVLGFPYLLLLNFACRQPADFRAEMRQFAVARTEGHGTESRPEVVFLSAFHRLD